MFWFSCLNTVLVSSQTSFVPYLFSTRDKIYYCFYRNEMQGKNKPTLPLPLPLTSSSKQLLKMGVLNSWEKRMPSILHRYLKHLASSVTVQTLRSSLYKLTSQMSLDNPPLSAECVCARHGFTFILSWGLPFTACPEGMEGNPMNIVSG